MKTNIYLKIENQEQLDKVQEIVFNAGGKWFCGEVEPQLFDSLNLCKCIKICDDKVILRAISDDCNNSNFVDTKLFISTNGTCNIDNIKYVNWKLKGTDEKPLRIPTTKETEELNKQIDNLCLKNSFWDKEKIEYSADETPKYYGEVNLELSNNATNPNHYNQMKIQPNEYITANYDCFSWNTANVIKYTSRYKSKNGIEDLEKAIKYLQFEIEELRKAEQ